MSRSFELGSSALRVWTIDAQPTKNPVTKITCIAIIPDLMLLLGSLTVPRPPIVIRAVH